MLKLPPSQFIQDCFLQWLAPIGVYSAPVIVNGCSSERPDFWSLDPVQVTGSSSSTGWEIECSWQSAAGLSFHQESTGPPDWNTWMSHYFVEENTARTMNSVFKSIPSIGTKSTVMLFSPFPWDLSSLSASGMKPVIWNLHPYYLLPSPSICTLSKSPGQRCHYTQSLRSQVQSRDLTEC